ncbi:MAG: 4a-hydroxytetrahydrobiopterin dehydratase [Planctomycetes bacterium]|nr:4a-hydroxytetrahydrobiopterin dehydratase [Planctomycetota bacterium]
MAIQTATELRHKSCQPCEGGVPELSADEARRQLAELDGWELSDDGKRIRRKFKMKDFMAAIELFNDIARTAEDEGHHPDLHLKDYRKATVELTTHAVGGLTENDFILAAKIDALPARLKE